MGELQALCKKYGMSRLLLINILKLWTRGYHKTEIGDKLGIHRLTVGKYIQLLRKMSNKEIKLIYSSTLLQGKD